tara:strand:+ start:123 stop:1574 length:1452 start_codon:yes stop_codon:yes gene_type:complete
MKRLFLAIATTALLNPLQGFGQSSEHPDILFISIDDLNDWVGPLSGHPQAQTPNMDRLADQGIVFTNARSPAVLCNPSRTALMTGIHPSNSGVYMNQPDWRTLEQYRNIQTIPRYFRDAGYQTVGAGKLFHSSTYNTPAYFGFNDTNAWDFYYPSLERQIPDEIRPHDRPANGNPISQNFDWGAVAADDRAMGDGQVTAWSIDKILEPSPNPKFNAVGIYRPHLPWYLPQKYFDMYPLDQIELPPFLESDLDDLSDYAKQLEAQSIISMPPMKMHDWIIEAGLWREGVRAYLASISFADTMLGHILDALEQSGRQNNTIIILWSDHGFHLGEKHRWRKHTLWNESTRVPLIIVAPGITQPGSRSNVTVSLMDIYPTLTELSGLETPNHVEGESLVPILQNPELEWDRSVITTHGYRNHAVTQGNYRYIRYSDGSDEFYDLEIDPNEWFNLTEEPEIKDIKDLLISELPKNDAPDARGGNSPGN